MKLAFKHRILEEEELLFHQQLLLINVLHHRYRLGEQLLFPLLFLLRHLEKKPLIPGPRLVPYLKEYIYPFKREFLEEDWKGGDPAAVSDKDRKTGLDFLGLLRMREF